MSHRHRYARSEVEAFRAAVRVGQCLVPGCERTRVSEQEPPTGEGRLPVSSRGELLVEDEA